MKHTTNIRPMSSSTKEPAMTYSFPFRPRKIAFLSALTLIVGLASTSSQAQWTVIDPASIAKNVAEYGEQAKRWMDTIAQYQRQIAHFQNMINTFTNLPSLLSSLMPNTLTRMSDSDKANLVEQNCPGASGVGLVQQILTSTGLSAPSFGQNIAANQQAICAKMTQLQIDMYNDSVDALNKLDQYTASMKSIEDMRNSITEGDPNSIGKLQGVLDQATRTSGDLNAEMEAYKQKTEAKQKAIDALKSQQSMLANVALKGKPSFTGQLVQAAAFTAAFSN